MALPTILAIGGGIIICLGSLIVINAPGDGQTGMIAIPLWIIGTILGVIACRNTFMVPSTVGLRMWVGLCAASAIGSVVWSLIASARYTNDRRQSPPVDGSGEG